MSNLIKGNFLITTLLIGVGVLLITAIIYKLIYIPQAESYTVQKGAPEKPPKGVYNTVTGTVYNPSGQPISGAKVETSQKTVKRNFFTDQSGKYTIEFPYCENCKSVITYSATGYQSVSIDTYQIAGGTLIQDVVLPKLQ